MQSGRVPREPGQVYYEFARARSLRCRTGFRSGESCATARSFGCKCFFVCFSWFPFTFTRIIQL